MFNWFKPKPKSRYRYSSYPYPRTSYFIVSDETSDYKFNCSDDTSLIYQPFHFSNILCLLGTENYVCISQRQIDMRGLHADTYVILDSPNQYADELYRISDTINPEKEISYIVESEKLIDGEYIKCTFHEIIEAYIFAGACKKGGIPYTLPSYGRTVCINPHPLYEAIYRYMGSYIRDYGYGD